MSSIFKEAKIRVVIQTVGAAEKDIETIDAGVGIHTYNFLERDIY